MITAEIHTTGIQVNKQLSCYILLGGKDSEQHEQPFFNIVKSTNPSVNNTHNEMRCHCLNMTGLTLDRFSAFSVMFINRKLKLLVFTIFFLLIGRSVETKQNQEVEKSMRKISVVYPCSSKPKNSSEIMREKASIVLKAS